MIAPMPHLWTGDEYDRLPADDGVRRELVDGVLHVSPSPADPHQTLAAELCVVLRRSAPRELYHVTQGVEVRLGERLRFIPDVLAVTAAAARRRASQYLPHEVVLAVEIESPSSVSMDRLLKPGRYADAGIPYYWRVELDPALKLVAHEIDDVYRVVGEFTKEVVLPAPWPIAFDLRELAD
jgi:Uma2 family endonuclease